MKIAVTAKENNLNALIDPRFGRAAFIIIVNTETMSFEVIDNKKNQNAFKNAGIQAARIIRDKGAEALITNYCGPNAYDLLKAAGIKVADRLNGRVVDVINNFKKGQLIFSETANKEQYW